MCVGCRTVPSRCMVFILCEGKPFYRAATVSLEFFVRLKRPPELAICSCNDTNYVEFILRCAKRLAQEFGILFRRELSANGQRWPRKGCIIRRYYAMLQCAAKISWLCVANTSTMEDFLCQRIRCWLLSSVCIGALRYPLLKQQKCEFTAMKVGCVCVCQEDKCVFSSDARFYSHQMALL